MSITQLTRFKSGNAEEMIKAARQAKTISKNTAPNLYG